MKLLLRFCCFFVLFLMIPESVYSQKKNANPAAPGFNLAGSDAKAVKIADQVMAAMGGRKAWDNTRYLQWTFFGRRQLLWDKWESRVRIDYLQDSTVFLLDISKKTGRVMVKGIELTHPDSLKKYLDQAESIWINDSYWLVMPFKLKDSGVTLQYIGQDTIQGGAKAEVLQLTFQDVGKTPDNKYLVYVDAGTHLVAKWSYFRNFKDEQPSITNPWTGYQRFGQILLSGERGRNQLTGINVYSTVPEAVFQDFKKPGAGSLRP